MGARLSDDVDVANKTNAASDEIAKQVNQGLNIPYAKAVERSIGKGCLINTPKTKGIPQGKCTELNTCLGERSPFNPAMIWIDAYGNVMICYGVIIGNLNQQSLNDIIENYSPERYQPINNLAQNGPKTLYHEAVKNGYNVPENYFDVCDICYQSRSALRKNYPKVFGPNECYPV